MDFKFSSGFCCSSPNFLLATSPSWRSRATGEPLRRGATEQAATTRPRRRGPAEEPPLHRGAAAPPLHSRRCGSCAHTNSLHGRDAERKDEGGDDKAEEARPRGEVRW
uniref:Uncharacterized protein n=1 Tax=Oryza rufipogon TaxID=4529 RepID=A0A0E0RBK2_ORYRU